jgi:hypothetical protein
VSNTTQLRPFFGFTHSHRRTHRTKHKIFTPFAPLFAWPAFARPWANPARPPCACIVCAMQIVPSPNNFLFLCRFLAPLRFCRLLSMRETAIDQQTWKLRARPLFGWAFSHIAGNACFGSVCQVVAQPRPHRYRDDYHLCHTFTFNIGTEYSVLVSKKRLFVESCLTFTSLLEV